MAFNDVSLSSGMRTNLLQLQKVNSQIEDKQNILATGNKINSALDGPSSFFAAKGLTQRAGDLTALKDSMGQAVSTIKAADQGVTAITSLIEQAKGLTTAAYSALGTDAGSVATRKSLAEQFNTLKEQIDKVAGDSGFGGKNLIAGNGLRLDATSSSRASVNSMTGIDNAKVTNVVSTDSYTIRVSGDGSVEGKTGDIGDAENAHGLTGLKISGTMSSSFGNFGDVKIEVRGAEGRERSFIVSDGEETRTIKYFDNTQSAEAKTTATAKSGTAQTSTVDIKGTIEEGDVFTITVENETFTYTASADDVAMGQDARANVATALATSISTAVTGGRLQGKDLATATATNGQIAFTGETTAGVVRDVTISAKAENAATTKISESFASGTVVSFTVDRALLEQAANGGNGVSSIEKKVDIQVDVTNLSGSTVSRSGMNDRGDGKLADGENSFDLGTGTVRFKLDENKIQGAATNGEGANLVTTQVTDANTSNDLTVQLNERNTNAITVGAENLTTSGQGLQIDFAQNDWADRADIDKATASIDGAQQKLRAASQNLSTNLNIITTREDFTKEFSDVLVEGANKLTLADQNEEGASLLALQTRQQLGTIALSLANQSQQSILRLF